MLTSAFELYCDSPADPKRIRRVAKALKAAGLEGHADLLHQLLSKKPGKKFYNPWTDGDAFVQRYPPSNFQVGDIWLDLLDLTPHLFCFPQGDHQDWEAGWYALHPVMNWQYLVFTTRLRYEIVKQPYFAPGRPVLLFSGLHAQSSPELAPVTNVYYYEAACYAVWSGKILMGENIRVARDIPWNSILLSIAPKGLNLWDSGGYLREDDPTAFNLETAMYSELEELGSLPVPPEMKVVYDEWEKNEHAGFSCMVQHRSQRAPVGSFVYPYLNIHCFGNRQRLFSG